MRITLQVEASGDVKINDILDDVDRFLQKARREHGLEVLGVCNMDEINFYSDGNIKHVSLQEVEQLRLRIKELESVDRHDLEKENHRLKEQLDDIRGALHD